MTDKATITEGAQTDKEPGASNEELRNIFAAMLSAEVNDIDSRRKHSENINPVIVRSAEGILWIRWGIVIIAATTPLVLLGLLYWRMYCGDSVPAEVTIGTFASFIVVYTALIVGTFRGISGASREKESASGISSAAFDAISKMTGGE